MFKSVAYRPKMQHTQEIFCGECMFSSKEMKHRLKLFVKYDVFYKPKKKNSVAIQKEHKTELSVLDVILSLIYINA